MQEQKKCRRTFFEKQENGLYKKVTKEVSCSPKKKCKDGRLARPTKDGRYMCKHDRDG